MDFQSSFQFIWILMDFHDFGYGCLKRYVATCRPYRNLPPHSWLILTPASYPFEPNNVGLGKFRNIQELMGILGTTRSHPPQISGTEIFQKCRWAINIVSWALIYLRSDAPIPDPTNETSQNNTINWPSSAMN